MLKANTEPKQRPTRQELARLELLNLRKRSYRVGLNLFNKQPEVGIEYLVKKKFLDNTAKSIVWFLQNADCVSKLRITEYLNKINTPFRKAVLEEFVKEIDISGITIDAAFRRVQSFFRLKDEILNIMTMFAEHYVACNPDIEELCPGGAYTVDCIGLSIAWLNRNFHSKNLGKRHIKITFEQFYRYVRDYKNGDRINRQMLLDIFERVQATELRNNSDHVSDVVVAERTILGLKQFLAEPHRRLVSFNHFYEVDDVQKKQKSELHHRRMFLFNDLLVVTKLLHRGRYYDSYTFRQSFPLVGIQVQLYSNDCHEFGVRVTRGTNVLLNLNARNDYERLKFTEELKECILETEETGRIEALVKGIQASGIKNESVFGGPAAPENAITEPTATVDEVVETQEQENAGPASTSASTD